MIRHPSVNIKHSPNFVRFTHQILANIKYDVFAYVIVDVKRMSRKCQKHGNLTSNLQKKFKSTKMIMLASSP